MAGTFRFTFGPWNIHEGADPFGPDPSLVREGLDAPALFQIEQPVQVGAHPKGPAPVHRKGHDGIVGQARVLAVVVPDRSPAFPAEKPRTVRTQQHSPDFHNRILCNAYCIPPLDFKITRRCPAFSYAPARMPSPRLRVPPVSPSYSTTVPFHSPALSCSCHPRSRRSARC